jgi:hypothetical protein
MLNINVSDGILSEVLRRNRLEEEGEERGGEAQNGKQEE